MPDFLSQFLKLLPRMTGQSSRRDQLPHAALQVGFKFLSQLTVSFVANKGSPPALRLDQALLLKYPLGLLHRQVVDGESSRDFSQRRQLVTDL